MLSHAGVASSSSSGEGPITGSCASSLSSTCSLRFHVVLSKPLSSSCSLGFQVILANQDQGVMSKLGCPRWLCALRVCLQPRLGTASTDQYFGFDLDSAYFMARWTDTLAKLFNLR